MDGYHQLDGHEFEQALGAGDGQGSLACSSPWSCKESDTTEQQQQSQTSIIKTKRRFSNTEGKLS